MPGRLYVLRTGQLNTYPDSRPLNNPYRGRSAMVARQLRRSPARTAQGSAIGHPRGGGESFLSQVSKAVTAMEEDGDSPEE